MKKFLCLVVLSMAGVSSLYAKNCKDDLVSFISAFEAKVDPAYKNAAGASYKAKISGKESDYNRSSELQVELVSIYSNKDDYKKIKEMKTCADVKKDPDLKRRLDLISNLYTANQIDPKKLEKMIKLQTEIENKFSLFRAKVNGKELTDNQIEDLLKNSADSKELEAAWSASKAIGPVVASDVKKLVLMRNQAARELGFKNYHQMMLKLNEQDPAEIEKLFNELDVLTRPAYMKLKQEIDLALSKKYNVPVNKLEPWHYQNRYFQEAPQIYSIDLDNYYKKVDIAETAEEYFDGIGLNIDEIMDNSDLYEKKGKYQHQQSIMLPKI